MLTKEEELLSKEDVRGKIELLENSGDRSEYTTVRIKELRLILKYKIVQERLSLENKIRRTLKTERVSGNYQIEDVAKVLGINKRQAMELENKVLSKLKSPTYGKKLRTVLQS